MLCVCVFVSVFFLFGCVRSLIFKQLHNVSFFVGAAQIRRLYHLLSTQTYIFIYICFCIWYTAVRYCHPVPFAANGHGHVDHSGSQPINIKTIKRSIDRFFFSVRWCDWSFDRRKKDSLNEFSVWICFFTIFFPFDIFSVSWEYYTRSQMESS